MPLFEKRRNKIEKQNALEYQQDFPWLIDMQKFYQIIGATFDIKVDGIEDVKESVQQDFYAKYMDLPEDKKKKINEATKNFGHICLSDKKDKSLIQIFSQSVKDLLKKK